MALNDPVYAMVYAAFLGLSIAWGAASSRLHIPVWFAGSVWVVLAVAIAKIVGVA